MVIGMPDIRLYFSYHGCEGHLGVGSASVQLSVTELCIFSKNQDQTCIIPPTIKGLFWVVGAVVVM